MNFWGFTPAIFDEIERRFPDFLAEGLRENPQAEMLIPNLVGRLLREGLCSVDVMRSSDVWYGMTYREDKPGRRRRHKQADGGRGIPTETLEIKNAEPSGSALFPVFQRGPADEGAALRQDEHPAVTAAPPHQQAAQHLALAAERGVLLDEGPVRQHVRGEVLKVQARKQHPRRHLVLPLRLHGMGHEQVPKHPGPSYKICCLHFITSPNLTYLN